MLLNTHASVVETIYRKALSGFTGESAHNLRIIRLYVIYIYTMVFRVKRLKSNSKREIA